MKTLIIGFLLFSLNSWAKLNVKTTLPELNWLVQEIGGEFVESSSLLSGHEDPHFVDVTPAFIFKIKKIDLLVKNGLALESTWLPKIIELSGNKKLKDNGLCSAANDLVSLGKVENTDRSMGDVHPEGNPHYTYSPKQMIKAARSITNCLKERDSSQQKKYEDNFKKLSDKLMVTYESVKNELIPYKELKFMTYHEEFKYFCEDFGLKCLITLEETPGVLPSASNIAKKSIYVKKNNISMLLATDSNPKRILDKFKELSGLPYGQIEAHMNTKIKSYDEFVKQIVKVIKVYGK